MFTREDLTELVMPVLEEHGLELVELQIQRGRRPVLRFFIDSSEGVDVGHCALIARAIERKLEAKDPNAREFVLEVSSAGMNRRIWLIEHFERYVGEQVVVTLKEAEEEKTKIKGIIEAVEGNRIMIRLAEGERLELTADAIEKARLDIDPWQGKRAGGK